MNNLRLTTTDVSHGVDFERAKERLSQAAAAAMRRYRLAKHGGTARDADVANLRAGVAEAQERARRLRPTDHAAIAEILSAH